MKGRLTTLKVPEYQWPHDRNLLPDNIMSQSRQVFLIQVVIQGPMLLSSFGTTMSVKVDGWGMERRVFLVIFMILVSGSPHSSGQNPVTWLQSNCKGLENVVIMCCLTFVHPLDSSEWSLSWSYLWSPRKKLSLLPRRKGTEAMLDDWSSIWASVSDV